MPSIDAPINLNCVDGASTDPWDDIERFYDRGFEFTGHQSGSRVWIDWFMVPKDERGRGQGRAFYGVVERCIRTFEGVREIRAYAADTGNGPTDEFWFAMGFEQTYPGAEQDDDKHDLRKTLDKTT